MVEYTGENAERFSFSGAAAQLRGSSPTAGDSSGSSVGSKGSPSCNPTILTTARKSSNSPQVGRRRPPTSSPSPTATVQSTRPPNRPTMPNRPTIPARPTFSFTNPPTTRNPSSPPSSRRGPNSQSPDYGPPDDDLDDLEGTFGVIDEAGVGENSGEKAEVENPEAGEAGEEAQHEAQNQTAPQQPAAPKSTTKSKSKSKKAKAQSSRVSKQSQPKPVSAAKTPSASRPRRRPRQTIETPSDAPAQNTRSQTGVRGGRMARSGGSRFGYEELERVEREGRRMRRGVRERRNGKGRG